MNSNLLGGAGTVGNLQGGLAEFVRIPHADSCLVEIPDEISDEIALFVADMLATGFTGADNCNLKPGDTVAVFGAGPVGLCAVHTARLYSPSMIILVDSRSNRLRTGLEMGATHIIDAAEEGTVAKVMELTDGRGVDAVMEAVGFPEALDNAAQVMVEGGILTSISTFPPGAIGVPMRTLFFKAANVKVRRTELTNMRRLMGLVAAGRLDPSPLITHRMPFSEFEKAYDIFSKKQENVLKIVLKP